MTLAGKQPGDSALTQCGWSIQGPPEALPTQTGSLCLLGDGGLGVT